MKINAPGSWHDSKVAQDIYDLLIEDTPDGYCLLADTAFPKLGEGANRKILTPLKAGARLPGLTRAEKLDAINESNAITSARQAVEWGMRAVQSSFGRLRIPLDINDPEGRSILIETCLRLHNIRAHRVGVNQIRTVYMPVWTGGQPDFFERMRAMMFPQIRRQDRVRNFHLVLEDN